MTGPDPKREPSSETDEKEGILKSHEEFIGNDGPSMTKQEYEKHKERERQKAGEKSDREPADEPRIRPQNE